MNRWITSILFVLVTLSFAQAHATTFGKKKKGLKGRYLELSDDVNPEAYRGAVVILEKSEIRADKDRPVDNETIRAATDEMLRTQLMNLKTNGTLDRVISSAPIGLPDHLPVLRLEPTLSVQHGSQAMRAFVGFGAGKAKTHIRIEIIDARSGEHVGYFNGYGSGSGSWTFSGGNTARMAQDDVEESFQLFADYLQLAIHPAAQTNSVKTTSEGT